MSKLKSDRANVWQNDTQREADIQKLCQGVLSTSAIWWDDPNGGYESKCPFCYATEISGDSATIPMHEIEHKPNCEYLIAKDLSTNL